MSKASPLVAGGIYACQDSDGSYRIVKVLVLDEHAAHLRSYANRFNEIPVDLDPAQLTMGSVSDGKPFGIGHYPVFREGFEKEDKTFLIQQPVLDDELDGYRIWAGIDPLGE